VANNLFPSRSTSSPASSSHRHPLRVLASSSPRLPPSLRLHRGRRVLFSLRRRSTHVNFSFPDENEWRHISGRRIRRSAPADFPSAAPSVVSGISGRFPMADPIWEEIRGPPPPTCLRDNREAPAFFSILYLIGHSPGSDKSRWMQLLANDYLTNLARGC